MICSFLAGISTKTDILANMACAIDYVSHPNVLFIRYSKLKSYQYIVWPLSNQHWNIKGCLFKGHSNENEVKQVLTFCCCIVFM